MNLEIFVCHACAVCRIFSKPASRLFSKLDRPPVQLWLFDVDWRRLSRLTSLFRLSSRFLSIDDENYAETRSTENRGKFLAKISIVTGESKSFEFHLNFIQSDSVELSAIFCRKRGSEFEESSSFANWGAVEWSRRLCSPMWIVIYELVDEWYNWEGWLLSLKICCS